MQWFSKTPHDALSGTHAGPIILKRAHALSTAQHSQATLPQNNLRAASQTTSQRKIVHS